LIAVENVSGHTEKMSQRLIFNGFKLTVAKRFSILGPQNPVFREGISGMDPRRYCVGNPRGAVNRKKEDPETMEVDV
jgi:hypothetical protein